MVHVIKEYIETNRSAALVKKIALPKASSLQDIKNDFWNRIEFLRLATISQLSEKSRIELGQVFTPKSVAVLMASFFPDFPNNMKLLDAGAGVGSLTAAVVMEIIKRKKRPKYLELNAYEKDPSLINFLTETLKICDIVLREHGVIFQYKILNEDFIESSVDLLTPSIPKKEDRLHAFNLVILNPPYRKISADSRERLLFRKVGIETTNLYTGFLNLTLKLLEPKGTLVAITPRSFCNGTYFRNFREEIIKTSILRRFHIFEKRDTAFSDSNVLQENIIMVIEKGEKTPKKVIISSSINGEHKELIQEKTVDYQTIIRKSDPEYIFYLPTDELKDQLLKLMRQLPARLETLKLKASTGKVVDFRATEYIIKDISCINSAPLFYPYHFDNGQISWPKTHAKKPDAITLTKDSEFLIVPNENYVLIKRFSSKEEKKRLVAACYEYKKYDVRGVGIENHLNYIHSNGHGLPLLLARGLSLYLNSTFVDSYFRIFSGHTQVNANDLERLPIPSKSQLEELGKSYNGYLPDQKQIDDIVNKALFENSIKEGPIMAMNKIDEALLILKALQFPREQINERSALTLLALVNLTPRKRWDEAGNPLMGITPMMDFFKEHYGKVYKPNTRETVRRFTIHQFVAAGLAIPNPDKLDRPINSPKYVYQVEPLALELIRKFNSAEWEEAVKKYLHVRGTLSKKYARERQMKMIAVKSPDGKEFKLSPGGQNELIKAVIEQFIPRFAPGGYVVYIGDTAGKDAFYDKEYLNRLNISLDEHGKFPDIIVHYKEKNWLLLVEAVTSHGPVNPKRHEELKILFKSSRASLVFVTTFLTKKAMVKYLPDIAWETEVWIAESPTHMIHFDGKRFLGPF